jgi:hypothetical protein
MNTLFYFIIFIISVLIYLKYQQKPIDNFKTDLCQQYESNGKQCPYRVHYRNGILDKKNKITWEQIETDNKPEINNNSNLTNVIFNSETVNSTCNRGGNGDIVKRKLVEGKDYKLVFGKYPVMISDSDKLNRYPWWRDL